MRSIWIRAVVAVVLLIGAFVAAVAVLTQVVYSPTGFVRSYIEALERKDIEAALRLAGPPTSSSALDDLLEAPILAGIESFEIAEFGSGATRTVTVDYVADGVAGQTSFQVRQSGTLLGVFPLWEFASSPYAVVDITVLNSREFTANGFRLVTPEYNQPARYLAFTPGTIRFEHESTYLESRPVTLALGSPSRPAHVELAAVPNPEFRSIIQEQVDSYLDECAAQPLLYPRGCPFGYGVSDRVASEPTWRIVDYPMLAVNATSIPGEWHVPAAIGNAELTVELRSIFDGSYYEFTTTVPFRVGFVVTFVGEDEIVVTPQLT